MKLVLIALLAWCLLMSGCSTAPLSESPSKAYIEHLYQPDDASD